MADQRELQDFANAQDKFGDVVAQIRRDQWNNQTPCTDWDVRTLVNHLVGEQCWAEPMLAGRTIADVGDSLDGDLLGHDPLASWTASAENARDAFSAPGALEGTIHSSMGDTDRHQYLNEMTLDLIVHRWDLGRGIGDEQRFDPNELARLRGSVEQLSAMADQLVAAGVFAEAVPVADDANEQTRLLAKLGRRA